MVSPQRLLHIDCYTQPMLHTDCYYGQGTLKEIGMLRYDNSQFAAGKLNFV